MEKVRYTPKTSVQYALKTSAYFVNYVNIHTLKIGVLYSHKLIQRTPIRSKTLELQFHIPVTVYDEENRNSREWLKR